MQTMLYSEWKDTADTLHMILQMMGKVKLGAMPPQPEWNHALLSVTTDGFSTGLIPGEYTSFEIHFDLHASRVSARCTSGREAGFPVRGKRSVSSYYEDFRGMLAFIGHPVTINTTPQEVADTTPFEQQTYKHAYDVGSARHYFDTAVFAHNALLRFVSPIRGKKILPSLFWGTFDMTTMVFSGEEKPFPGKGMIEKAAFDEQFIEFGYWPGDPAADEPAFFAMPYPFLQSSPHSSISPAEAFYSDEKKEYMLRLSDVLGKDAPQAVVCGFCHDVFAATIKTERWNRANWFTKPLPGQ